MVLLVELMINRTGRRRSREVERTLLLLRRSGIRRRWECGTALLGEEAGHRRRGRQRQRSDRRRAAVRAGRHRQGRAQRKLMLLLLLLLLLLVLLEQCGRVL